MTAIYRPNSSWGPPPSAVTRPDPRSVERRLSELAPLDQKWTRARDLSVTEQICAGMTIADASKRQRLSETAVRARWLALKAAASDEEGRFGIFEQEALLLALRALAAPEKVAA